MSKRIVFVGVSTLGVALLILLQANPWQAASSQTLEQRAAPAPAVSYITVEPRYIDMDERLPGRTSAYRVAEVRPQVNGIIMERLFEEGALVEQGQALYQIDADLYEAALASAQAQLHTAQSNEELTRLREQRYARLVGTQAISQQDYDTAKAELAQAEAAVEAASAAVRTAQINLDYTRVYAPISGQISQSMFTEGALVNANQAQALAVITQLDPIYVDLVQSGAEHLPMRGALSKAGEIAVELEVEGVAKDSLSTGTLQFSNVWVDPGTGAVSLRALFSNPDQILLPGMFVHARLQLGSRQAILVPQQATQRNAAGELTVWKIEQDGTVNPVPVTEEREIGNQWLLTSGVGAGDRLVVEGFQYIAPGIQVNATPY